MDYFNPYVSMMDVLQGDNGIEMGKFKNIFETYLPFIEYIASQMAPITSLDGKLQQYLVDSIRGDNVSIDMSHITL